MQPPKPATTSDKTALSAAIKAKARQLGFTAVGIIPASVLSQRDQHPLRDWLSKGYQAEMDWMANHLEKRLDPGSLMDGTRSIVCVAMNYFNEDAYDREDTAALKIAKYARGTDYHYVVKDKLKLLLAAIQELAPNSKGRALTDSAPIWERALATKAGLGWVGKNGNLINSKHGSFLFLGELLLDIDLDCDTPMHTQHCGTCTRCIDACPTEAIVQNSVIDSRKCISYWTIEYKGESFPNAISNNLNGWLFGCYICQDVCPWNIKFAQPTAEPLFEPRPWNQTPLAPEILALDEETFRERYRKSPLKRTKLAGLKRNIAEAGF